MSEPWFRRWMVFGYIPIARQGWAVMALMGGGFIPFAVMFVSAADDGSFVKWVCAAVAATFAIGGHAIVFWKLKPD